MRWRKLSKPLADQTAFTIIEVLIVLAVTGVMFVSVALVINGRQQKAQFQTSLNEARSQIRSVGTQVMNGYFPAGNFECNVASGRITLVTKTANLGKCSYVGKALHFYKDDAINYFSVYSLVGIDGAGTLAAAKPVTVNQAGFGVPAKEKLSYGLRPGKMTYTSPAVGAAPIDIGSFAFMQSLNQGVSGSGSSGSSQYLDIVGFPTSGSNLTNNESTEAGILNSTFDSGGVQSGGTVTICFNSGSTRQYGVITVGGPTGKLDVATQIKGGSCADL